jgi:hypothetical protein
MPTISPRQQVIAATLRHVRALQISYYHCRHRLILSHTYADISEGSDSTSTDESITSTTSSTSSTSSITSSGSSSNSTPTANVIPPESDSLDTALASIYHAHSTAVCRVRKFLTRLLTTRVLQPNEVAKCSQLGLILDCFRFNDPTHFRSNLRVSPRTFNILLSLIEDNPIFHPETNAPTLPISYQLAITLYRFGHFGNAASVKKIAQWAGCSEGAVVNATCHVIRAFLPLHNQTIRWPTAQEKHDASNWVESVSCHAWRSGYCMVDGTLIPLATKPGHYGEQFFDRKSNYSLSLTV